MRCVRDVGSLALVLSLMACDQKSLIDGDGWAGPEDLHVAKEIGPAGGVVEVGDVSLTIPPNALTKTVTIQIQASESRTLSPYESFSSVWDFKPSGLTFERPVKVRMDYQGDEPNQWLFWSRVAGEEGYDALPFTQDGDIYVTQINHFSTGFIGSMEAVVDTVDIGEPQALDLLLVVDNSCSMGEEQRALLASAGGFFQEVDSLGVDYHIGIVTTDMEDPTHSGKLQSIGGYRYLDSSTPDPIDKLRQTLPIGYSGSVQEMGLAAAFTAVETLGTSIENSGFVREEAHLAMLVLSDEDDQSTVFGGGVVPSPKNFFSNWALGLKAYPEWVSFSSIVNLPTGCSAYGSPSFNYLSVTNAVGGEFGCISDSDYAPVLTALTDYLEGNGRYVELNYEPVESTIEVKVVDSSGIELVLDPTSWEFLPQSNAVYVSANGAVVELGASVYVTYTPMPI